MDTPFSPFRTIAYSERPEVVAAKILEGKVGLLVNGIPVVLTMPMFFIESLQNPMTIMFIFIMGR
jgi:spore germination protein KA